MSEERLYEMVLILEPNLEDEKIDERLKKIETNITESGGSVEDVTRWGKRRLAYPIQKKETGNYLLFTFRFQVDKLRDFERGLKLDEQILRYLIIQKEKNS